MARKREPNKVHTSPERAGKQNLKGMELPKDDTGLMKKIFPAYLKGKENRQHYKGLWTPEALENEITDFFTYCMEVDIKPTVPLLTTWLGVSRVMFWEWRTKPSHGDKFNIVNEAMAIMEAFLQGNMDKYPTGSIFLLKTTHGHVESSKLDITSNGNSISDPAEVKDAISKLGLKKDSD